MITLDILGSPAPKGSARAMNIGGRARLIASSSGANQRNQRRWAKAIATAAQGAAVIAGPVCVSVTFRLARPKGHYGKRGLLNSAPLHPTVKPDIDKLVRCTLDALTGLAFEDDSRIVSLYVGKTYAVPGREGAKITVCAWPMSMPLVQNGPGDYFVEWTAP
jgi:Holliday junction resolvase RusA-like endonuclease